MTFGLASVMVLILCIVVIPVIAVCFHLEPRQITYLSPPDFDAKMLEIQNLRLEQIDQADTQEQIDTVNRTYDEVSKNYKVK